MKKIVMFLLMEEVVGEYGNNNKKSLLALDIFVSLP